MADLLVAKDISVLHHQIHMEEHGLGQTLRYHKMVLIVVVPTVVLMAATMAVGNQEMGHLVTTT